MKSAYPGVFLIAATAMLAEETHDWLDSISGAAVLDHIAGDDAERLTELAGRRCYKSFDVGLNPNITRIRKDSEQYHANILESRHGSVLEHATCTWAFEGVSRVFTHELVRNRIGNAFSQESLRYVRLSDGIPFWVPPEIAANQEACELFERAVADMEDWQRELSRIFSIDDMKDFAAKKKLTSAFRRIAPDGLATGIVFSTNMRSLRWIIEQRTSRHAEYEIRLVFNRVAEIAVYRWPMIFQDFSQVDTGDGHVKEWAPRCSKI
jgi:thymidylate synthase (FAD)